VKSDYPRTEWDPAIDGLRDADLLLANGGFDGAASRAYYAAFHAVTALFALDGASSRSTPPSRLRFTAIS
jgi:uncharacterized protein (UPF0332 family)